MRPRVRILNGEFDPLTLVETADAVFELVRARKRGWLCTVNVATLMAMRDDPRLQSFVDRAAIVVADGQPLVWCAPLFHGRLPERVAGIDLIDAICARSVAAGAGIYLLGSTDPLLQRALTCLRQRYPGLRIVGADGYFTLGEAPDRAEAIASSGSSILLVGMGSPLQEDFIQRHWSRLGVAVAIGVGGSFDVLAGARFRAPVPMRRAGLEWLVRLVQEPRRLLPRYAGTNTRFCLLIVDALVLRLKRWIRAT
ncbi:MAG TPA: WecB/TagA/CpsF family glycosyltransferase [Caldimonas sp.]|nr:WecB/TagA/CpsF family glycosyltransferase [Caldimonas sp.]HEX2540226.1 WecB/TagA/CpsF family glycosyltransferase [Caldimonas sp.]